MNNTPFSYPERRKEQFMFLLVLIAMEEYFSIQTTTYVRDSEIVC
jgi:hypothetical protein